MAVKALTSFHPLSLKTILKKTDILFLFFPKASGERVK